MQKYRDKMGGVSRYFSKVSGSGVDLTLQTNGWMEDAEVAKLGMGQGNPIPDLLIGAIGTSLHSAVHDMGSSKDRWISSRHLRPYEA